MPPTIGYELDNSVSDVDGVLEVVEIRSLNVVMWTLCMCMATTSNPRMLGLNALALVCLPDTSTSRMKE